MKKEKNEKKKKKAIIIVSILVLCFVAAGIFAGLTLTNDADAKDVPELKANEVEIVNEDGEVEVVDKDSKEAEEYKDAVKSGERETVTATKKTENSSSSNKNSSSSNKNNSSSSNSSSSNKNNSSSGSSSSSSDKKNDSSSSSTKPTTHTHSWTAVYATKQVQVGTEYKCVGSIICCVCGARDIDTSHTKAHALAGEPSNSWREYIYDDVPVYETKEYVDYYKCSCGATK